MSAVATRKAIADLGKSSYISVVTGFWYDWMLGIPAGLGIDFINRTATLFDEGETKISVSTRPQVRLQLSIICSDVPLTDTRLAVLSLLFSACLSSLRVRRRVPHFRTSKTW